ncbi:hypothetical protein FBU59_004642, partial [Linderina macrospora]
ARTVDGSVITARRLAVMVSADQARSAVTAVIVVTARTATTVDAPTAAAGLAVIAVDNGPPSTSATVTVTATVTVIAAVTVIVTVRCVGPATADRRVAMATSRT